MVVTGFTFVRNAIKFDYPILESIKSILPICNNFVVAVGNSDDGTMDLIKSIDPQKIKIVQTVWDESLRKGGVVLAKEADKAFQAIGPETDWCFYIQGDEVVHEKYLPIAYKAMSKWKDHKEVDGFLFNYIHFYGSYDYTGISNKWYKHEIRIIRNNKNIYSYRDAQGFRKNDNEKLSVTALDACIYHYGWVKHPENMQKKVENSAALYHDDEWIKENILVSKEFRYENIDALRRFPGTHPAVMLKRISNKNWHFNYDLSFNRLSLKDRFKNFLIKNFNINLNYKNYRLSQ